jgi:hypothetical protein
MLQYTKKTDKAYKDRRLSALDLYHQIFVQLCAPSRFVHPGDGRARDLAMEKGTYTCGRTASCHIAAVCFLDQSGWRFVNQ